jgi:uncharacterized SAM-binding protein YcdF (DUF218 family)
VFLLLFSKTVRRVLASILLALVAVVLGTAIRVWYVARQDEHPRSDAIVVLGASQFDGRPSAVFKSRLDHARTLYDEHVATRIVTVGGGAPGDRFTEAQAGANYLRSKGVTVVVVVGVGRDTLQSLKAVKVEFARQGWKSTVLVTDPWHAMRSRRMATDLGLSAVVSPTRSGPAVATRSTELRYVLRETAAYLYYRLFHQSSEAGPHAV